MKVVTGNIPHSQSAKKQSAEKAKKIAMTTCKKPIPLQQKNLMVIAWRSNHFHQPSANCVRLREETELILGNSALNLLQALMHGFKLKPPVISALQCPHVTDSAR